METQFFLLSAQLTHFCSKFISGEETDKTIIGDTCRGDREQTTFTLENI